MPFRYFSELSFNGSKFCGYQIQPNGNTIQNEIQNALSTLLKEKIDITGAGRTDSRVHAKYFVIHFETSNELKNIETFNYKINCILPESISFYNTFRVEDNKHARFDAKSRTYRYFIHQMKDPFLNEYSLFISQKIDIKKMNLACRIIKEAKDFTSFSKLHTDTKTNICKVQEARVFEQNNKFYFEIKADRFLRNMVRAIVGTLLEIGMEKITLEQLKNIINEKDRSKAGCSVDGKALFLWDIEYNFFERSQNSI